MISEVVDNDWIQKEVEKWKAVNPSFPECPDYITRLPLLPIGGIVSMEADVDLLCHGRFGQVAYLDFLPEYLKRPSGMYLVAGNVNNPYSSWPHYARVTNTQRP